MERFFSKSNAMLVQGATIRDLESMMSRLLDKKLAKIVNSTTKVDEKPKDRLYRRKDAAEKLQISVATLNNWTKLGIINSRRIGTRIYYTESDIDNALEKVAKGE